MVRNVAPGQRDGLGDGGQVITEQDHVCGGDGHVGAGAEDQCQAGPRKGRAVVDLSPTMATERPSSCIPVTT